MSGKGWNGGRKSPFFPLFEDRKMSSSVCRFAMMAVRMLTGFHGDADGWACRMSEGKPERLQADFLFMGKHARMAYLHRLPSRAANTPFSYAWV